MNRSSVEIGNRNSGKNITKPKLFVCVSVFDVSVSHSNNLRCSRYVRTVRSSSNADVIDIINNVYVCLGCAAAASYSIKYLHWNKNKYRCHRLLILPYLEAHTFRWAITSVHNKQRKTIFSNEIENYWIWYWWALQYQFHFKLFTCTQRKFTNINIHVLFACRSYHFASSLWPPTTYCLCRTRARSHILCNCFCHTPRKTHSHN